MAIFNTPFTTVSRTCVLQYAKDTLTIVRSSTQITFHIKSTLPSFSLAVDLTINFIKNTFIAINISQLIALFIT